MFRTFTTLVSGLTFCLSTMAASVEAIDGNIVLIDKDNHRHQITATGKDAEPRLSPDGQTIVFVRVTPITTPVEEGEVTVTTELRTINKNSSQESLLLKESLSNEPDNNLQLFSSPEFSPSGDAVYFMTKAWATSGAIHKVDLASKNTRFISAGNSLEVIPSGEDVGKLIVQKHKYFAAGGTYDFYWLLTHDGKELSPVGDSYEMVKNFLDMNAKPKTE